MDFTMKITIIKIVLFIPLIFIIIFDANAQSGWTVRTALPTPRYGVCSAKLGNDIYIIGGIKYDQEEGGEEISKTVEKYNPITDNWDTGIDGLREERYNAAAVAFGGKIYVIGGRERNELIKSIEIFDPDSNEWSKSNYHLKHRREGAAAVVYDGKIYVIGGYDSDGSYLDSVEIFDPQKETGDEIENTMNFPRALLGAVTVEDTIFALGGFYYGPISAVEKFIPDNNWQTIASMSTLRASFVACAANNMIFAIGGHGQMEILKSIEAYNLATGDWEIKEPMNFAREAFTAQVVDNKIYVFGGSNDDQQFIPEVEEYDPEPASVDVHNRTAPENFKLYQNYPNPFNSQTIIRYELRKNNNVNLTIHNIHGRKVATLVNNEQQPPGRYQVYWGRTSDHEAALSSGVYFGILKAGNQVQKIKILLTK